MRKLRSAFGRKNKASDAALLSPCSHQTSSAFPSVFSRPASIQSTTVGSAGLPVAPESESNVNCEPASLEQTSVISGNESAAVQLSATAVVHAPMVPIKGPDAIAVDVRELLWSRAYHLLEERNEDLVKKYGKILQASAGEAANTDGFALVDPVAIKQTVSDLLTSRAEKQWKVTLGGNTITVKDTVEKLATLLVWSDKIIKDALSAQPYAALAWAGVSVFLPLLASASKQEKDMIEGFGIISDLQMYWKECEDLCLVPGQAESYSALVEPLSILYSHILEFQALAICHLSEHQFHRGWEKVTGAQDWAAKSKSIATRSEACKAFTDIGQQQELRKRTNEQTELLQGISTSTRQIADILQGQDQESKETELLRLLMSETRNHLDCRPVATRAKGTCEWFFNDLTFESWRDTNSSGLFWLSAGPGCGKSVLSKALIEEGHLQTSITTVSLSTNASTVKTNSSTLCYFFFKEGDEKRVNATNALCSILHQVFTDDNTRSLIHLGLALYRDNGSQIKNSTSHLWNLLTECSRQSNGPIICVLDALDECTESGRRELIDKLETFYQSSDGEARGKLKFFITSRPYDDIQYSFEIFNENTSYFRFDGDARSDDISHDINIVIDHELHRFGERRFTAETLENLCTRFKNLGTRTYLWLYLTMSIIQSNPSKYSLVSAIEELLSDVQPGLSHIYEKILSATKDEEMTKTMLHILLAARRPLSLQEANHAFILAREPNRFQNLDELRAKVWETGFNQVVKNLCGLLIQVHGSKISFIHLTAREFLLNRPKNPRDTRETQWEGRFSNESFLHQVLAKTCIDQLLFPDVPIHHTAFESDPECPFLWYAASNWAHHYSIYQNDAVSSVDIDDIKLLLDPAGNAIKIWVPMYFEFMADNASNGDQTNFFWIQTWNGWSCLAVASYFGFSAIVKALISTDASNMENSHSSFGTPLQIAAACGHHDVVGVLLARGALIETGKELPLTDGKKAGTLLQRHSALHAACEYGRYGLVKLLLSHGADVNFSTAQGTALQVACSRGFIHTVECLLSNGADPNIQNTVHSPIKLAVRMDAADTIAILLRHGAHPDLDARCRGNTSSPISDACIRGDAEIIKALLLAGADISPICEHLSDVHGEGDKKAPNCPLSYPRLHYTYGSWRSRNQQHVISDSRKPQVFDLVWETSRDRLPSAPWAFELAVAAAPFDEHRLLNFLVSKYGTGLAAKESNLEAAILSKQFLLVKAMLAVLPKDLLDSGMLSLAARSSTKKILGLLLDSFDLSSIDILPLFREALRNDQMETMVRFLFKKCPFDDSMTLTAMETVVNYGVTRSADTCRSLLQMRDTIDTIDNILQLLVYQLGPEGHIPTSLLKGVMEFAAPETVRLMLDYGLSTTSLCDTETEELMSKTLRNERWQADNFELVLTRLQVVMTTTTIIEVVRLGCYKTLQLLSRNLENKGHLLPEYVLIDMVSKEDRLFLPRLNTVLNICNIVTEEAVIAAIYHLREGAVDILLSRRPPDFILTPKITTACVLTNNHAIVDIVLRNFPQGLQMPSEVLIDLFRDAIVERKMFERIIQAQSGAFTISQDIFDAALDSDTICNVKTILESGLPLSHIEFTEAALGQIVKDQSLQTLRTFFALVENHITIHSTILKTAILNRDGARVLEELFERWPDALTIEESLVKAILVSPYSTEVDLKHEYSIIDTLKLIALKSSTEGPLGDLSLLASLKSASPQSLDLAYATYDKDEDSNQCHRGSFQGYELQSLREVPLLWLAIRFRRADVVRYLLAKDSTEVNYYDPDYGSSPLFLATALSDEYSFNCVEPLLGAGANPNIANKTGVTPLHITRISKDIYRLVEEGADANLPDQDGLTPLHYRFMPDYRPSLGDYYEVRALIQRGALVDASNRSGQSALHLCSMVPAKSDETTNSPVLMCPETYSEYCTEEDVRKYIKCQESEMCDPEMGDKFDWSFQRTSLRARLLGETKHSRKYIKKAALPYESELEVVPEMPLPQHTRTEVDRLLELLLHSGAEVNLQDETGHTPLHYATSTPAILTLKRLIDAGANVHLTTDTGRTALHLAALNGKKTRVEMLLNAGADANCRDGEGKTALDLAREGGHVETTAYLETVTDIAEAKLTE